MSRFNLVGTLLNVPTARRLSYRFNLRGVHGDLCQLQLYWSDLDAVSSQNEEGREKEGKSVASTTTVNCTRWTLGSLAPAWWVFWPCPAVRGALRFPEISGTPVELDLRLWRQYLRKINFCHKMAILDPFLDTLPPTLEAGHCNLYI